MASMNQQVRLLLDPATAHALHDLSLRESRWLAGTCMKLIKDSLENRRAASASTQRLIAVLKGETSKLAAQ